MARRAPRRSPVGRRPDQRGDGQPAGERLQVHRRRRHAWSCRRRRRTTASASRCATPAPGSRRTSCRTSSRSSTRRTIRAPPPRADPGSASRSPRRSSRRTAAASRCDSASAKGTTFTLLLPNEVTPRRRTGQHRVAGARGRFVRRTARSALAARAAPRRLRRCLPSRRCRTPTPAPTAASEWPRTLRAGDGRRARRARPPRPIARSSTFANAFSRLARGGRGAVLARGDQARSGQPGVEPRSIAAPRRLSRRHPLRDAPARGDDAAPAPGGARAAQCGARGASRRRRRCVPRTRRATRRSQRLRDELAKANAELTRIKRRLTRPRVAPRAQPTRNSSSDRA